MKQTVLDLLLEAEGGYRSGEEMSQRLGVTRAAVWKQIGRLRQRGYEIEAVTNLGYRLVAGPAALDLGLIRSHLGEHPWADRITVLESVDSTNSLAKVEAVGGAPHGSVYLAEEQTLGRGRMGRSFSSLRGQGVYLTVLLRPECTTTELTSVTALAAVAACDAVERTCGLRPAIKWTNDLMLGERKLAGILSELGVEWESGALEYLVIGIGVNCLQTRAQFPPELQGKATSLAMETGSPVDRNLLAAELIRALAEMAADFPAEMAPWMARYASDCMTVGRQVRVLLGDQTKRGVAIGVDPTGALRVRYDDGWEELVCAGEVSVRGTNGYI